MEICKIKKNVIDPYLGSGSTLIACDYTNRNCFGIEKDKSFLGASLEHMSSKTNKFYEFFKQL